MTTSAVYVRQSQDKTGHAAGVARQEQDCKKLADAKGWDEPKLYADNDISATSGKTRPAFEQLLKDIEAGAVTQVAVWHIDRLTRSMRDLTRIIEAGKARRVNIAAVHGVALDLGDPTGIAVAQILTAIASMEVSHKGARQRRANQQRAEQGKAFWTRRPFGYDRDGSHVFVVKAEAAAIRAGAEAVLSGATLASVARSWNEAGLFTTYYKKDRQTGLQAEGGKPWGVTQVRRVLLNPRYAGRRIYNGDDMGEGDWDAILTPEQHVALEEKLTDPRRRTAPDDLAAKYLLSGILTCAKCGGPMYATVGSTGKGVYRCFGGYCQQRQRADIDQVVTAAVMRLLRPAAREVLPSSADLKKLKTKAADARERRDALAAMLSEGLLGPQAVREQAGKLTAELRSLEEEIARAEGSDPLEALLSSDDLAASWEASPLESKRQIIRRFFNVSLTPSGKGYRFKPEQVVITRR